MKIKLLIAAIAITLFNCAGEKMDLAKAKETAEGCLKTIDKGDYAKVKSDYYSTELGEQSAEELENKFKKLKEVTGDIQSIELIESAISNAPGEEPKVMLTYSVKHTKITTTEKFVIIMQGDDYKVALQDIKN
jgi:hypothetical protein